MRTLCLPARSLFVLSFVASALALSACGGDSAPPAPQGGDINVDECMPGDPPAEAALKTEGLLANATFYPCDWPKRSSGTVHLKDFQADDTALTGIPLQLESSYEGTDTLDGHTVLVSAGSSGYFAVEVGERQDPFANLTGNLIWNDDVGTGDRNLRFAVLADGASLSKPVIGNTLNHSLYVIRVGSGDVQVSLKWNKKVDMDLSVVEPDMFKISYTHKDSPNGGKLDLDSYADCYFQDRGRGNENVYWGDMMSPRGNYRVAIKLFSACGSREKVHYRLVVVTDHVDVKIYEGDIDPMTEVGREKLITSFQH